MKILHTSDWHIGQRLYTRDRSTEHKLFFDWLIELINREKVELLIVSGDIFDIGFPPNQALQLYYQTLTRLQQSACRHVVITGGNHDSISTLNAPRQVLRYLNVHVVGGVPEKPQDQLIEIKNPQGETQLVVCAVPFLRDRDIRTAVAGESYQDRTKAIREGIIAHYTQIAQIAQKYSEQNIPIIATGHLFAAGASTTDSERDIHIGNLAKIEATRFPETFDYIALGHIHRPQKIAGKNHIRYSGAPIPLSFSERKDPKLLLMLETAKNKPIAVQEILVPQFRRLLSFRGTYQQVIEQIRAHQSQSQLADWAEVHIEEPHHQPELIERFNHFLEQTQNPQIIHYTMRFADQVSGTRQLFEPTTSLSEMQATEVFDKFLEKGEFENPAELRHTFNELLDYVHNTKNQ